MNRAPTLHHLYSLEEAIASFGPGTSPKILCDGQFVVLPATVVCLATVGNPDTEPHFPCPSLFVWKPQRMDYAPEEEWPWLPFNVREADRQKKTHHIFVRRAGSEPFFYAGAAHLGSYGGSGNDVDAAFHLLTKLPRSAWQHFGGFPDWLIEANHVSHRVDKGDIEGLNVLLRELPRQEFSHLTMLRYEEDSFHLYTNRSRGWLMYLRDPEDSGLYVRDLTYRGTPDAEEEFECTCGIELEFPAYQTLPKEEAIRAAQEFFLTGQLPRWIQWEEA